MLSSDGIEKPFGLTDREVEVLTKLASGATNRAIAADMVLSERTIDRHVSNIFTKLGVNTRSAATAAAIRNDIA
jgi:DNA-binding NarL/FixJ family response regulator